MYQYQGTPRIWERTRTSTHSDDSGERGTAIGDIENAILCDLVSCPAVIERGGGRAIALVDREPELGGRRRGIHRRREVVFINGQPQTRAQRRRDIAEVHPACGTRVGGTTAGFVCPVDRDRSVIVVV
jgi:hypothetical protein